MIIFLQYLFTLLIGIAIGAGLVYQVISAIVQYGIDEGQIKFEILEEKDKMMPEKYSMEEIAEIVDSEGSCYAVAEYMSHESIENEKLAEQWKIAGEALRKIEDILEEFMP